MKIEKALLITPPSGLYRRDDRCQCKVEDQTVAVTFPPMELGYLAAMLEKHGIECQIHDYPAEQRGWEEYKTDFKSFDPDLLVINTTTPTLKNDLIGAQLAKEMKPSIYTVGRGEYFSVHEKEGVELHPELDAAMRGEPELTMEELAVQLKNGKQLEGILGLTYRNGAGVVVNPARPLLVELDQLPFPSRHLMQHKLYRSPENNEPITVVHTQRGCPARCIFCSVGVVSGYKIRKRAPEKIVQEIKECVEKYHFRNFLFHADTFTWEKDWVIELCTRIIDADLHVHWGCNSRVDTIDPEMLKLMKKAGCWVIAFGIETGDQQILNKMKKGAKVEWAKDAVKMVREAGIKSHAFMVMGLPWETKETFENTIKFLKDLDTDFFDFNIAYPLPGTELMKIAEKENLIVMTDPGDGGYAHAALKTHALSPKELTEMRKKALWEMYLRPKYIARTLTTAGSPKNTLQYLKAAAKRAVNLMKS